MYNFLKTLTTATLEKLRNEICKDEDRYWHSQDSYGEWCETLDYIEAIDEIAQSRSEAINERNG